MIHDLIFILPYFFIIGILVGSLSMIFGIGGGLVIVPAISVFLQYFGYSHSVSMKTAVATSLLTIMGSSLNVLRHHHRSGHVPWFLVRKFLPCIITGSFIGSMIASQVPGHWLTYLFIIFLFYIIARALFGTNFKTTYHMQDFIEPGLINKNIVGFIVGILSVLIGVSGNILFMPYLRYYKFPMKNATAFTVGLAPCLAFIGSLGYFIEGIQLSKKMMPPYSLGYINLPAFLFIMLGSFLGARIGRKLLKLTDDQLQAKVYLIFLMVTFFCMLCTLIKI